MEFDRNVFARHNQPFAAYVEPEGHALLMAMRAPKLENYKNLIPRTYKIAEEMLSAVPMRQQWGHQYGSGESARWATKTAGRVIEVGNGKTCQREMQLSDALKHFSGRIKAMGNKDTHFSGLERWNKQTKTMEPVITSVQTLRVDVDMDDVFSNQNPEQLASEIYLQRQIAHSMGLAYGVFCTGGRGVQVVMPLPIAVPRPIASVLLYVYTKCLKHRQKPWSKTDKTNLKSIMRLPGGVHAGSGNVGLWIDPDAMKLYPIDIQAHLMAAGLKQALDPSSEVFEKHVFWHECKTLADYLKTAGVPEWDNLSERQFEQLVQGVPKNRFISHYLEARPITAIAVPQALPVGALNAVQQGHDSFDTPRNQSDGSGSEWAKGVWAEGYDAGASYEYFTKRGGIRAAVILFGNEAESHLRNQAMDMACRIEADMRQRMATIHSLVSSYQEYRRGKRDLQNEYLALLEHVKLILRNSQYQERKIAKLVLIAEILLKEFQYEKNEFGSKGISLSHRSICRIMKSNSVDCAESNVLKLLRCFTEGEECCIFRLIKPLQSFSEGLTQGYVLGSDSRDFLRGNKKSATFR